MCVESNSTEIFGLPDPEDCTVPALKYIQEIKKVQFACANTFYTKKQHMNREEAYLKVSNKK